MNVSLTPELQSFVEKKVNSGVYKSASDVIHEGLRLLAKQESRSMGFQANDAADLREKLQAGLDSLDAGRGIPSAEVFEEIASLRRAESTGRDG